MTTFSVKYKKPEWFFWRRLKNVKGDGILFTQTGQAVPMRYFILIDETRVELPMTMIFEFSPDRCRMIEEDMRRQRG